MRSGRVLVVGVGGLGAPAAWLLARAGVATIGLADPDVVELSNLNRQILFRTADIGRSKVEVAARVLERRFPRSRIERHPVRIDALNALPLFRTFDFIVDATDGVDAKYLINDGAALANKPLSHAGVVGLSGQTMTVVPGSSACLRCLFPDQPEADDVPSCQEAGILGPVAGAIAAVQASEALRFLAGEQPALTNRMLTWDVARWRWHRVAIEPSVQCPLCGVAPSITAATFGDRRVRASCVTA